MSDERLRRIRLLAMDVDGVLTSGEIIYSGSGDEIKSFNILDGLGLAVASKAGLLTAIVTGRASGAVERRAAELGVTEVCQGVRYKAAAVLTLMRKYSLAPAEVAFVGDDINDIPAFREVGYRIVPRNGSVDAKTYADYVTENAGGQGAVRETVEMILRAQGRWDSAVAEFLDGLKASECPS